MADTVRITISKASQRKKQWAKTVESVDRSAKHGYAIVGDFLDLGCEIDLPAGTIIYEYVDGDGRLMVVDPKGESEPGVREEMGWTAHPSKMATILDRIEELIADRDGQISDQPEEIPQKGDCPGNPLGEVGDNELIAECARRGFVIKEVESELNAVVETKSIHNENHRKFVRSLQHGIEDLRSRLDELSGTPLEEVKNLLMVIDANKSVMARTGHNDTIGIRLDKLRLPSDDRWGRNELNKEVMRLIGAANGRGETKELF